MEKRHFYDGLMYYPQQLQQCSCSFIIEFMNWYFMYICGSSGLVFTHCTPWCGRLLGVLEAVCKLSVLTISKIHTHSGFRVGWHHSFHVTAWSDSDWITHTDVQLWHSTYVTFLESIYCSYQMYFSFKISSAPKLDFFGGGPSSEFFFTTLLAITRLLDFEVTTLPYPTRSWKTTTRWSLVGDPHWGLPFYDFLKDGFP